MLQTNMFNLVVRFDILTGKLSRVNPAFCPMSVRIGPSPPVTLYTGKVINNGWMDGLIFCIHLPAWDPCRTEELCVTARVPPPAS